MLQVIRRGEHVRITIIGDPTAIMTSYKHNGNTNWPILSGQRILNYVVTQK